MKMQRYPYPAILTFCVVNNAYYYTLYSLSVFSLAIKEPIANFGNQRNQQIS